MVLQKFQSLTRNQANFLIFLASVFFSTSGLFIKLLTWNPFVIASLRSLLAALVAIVMMGTFRIKINKNTMLGGAIMALTLVSFVVANKLTASANAIMLQYTSPIFTLIISAIFLKTRVRRKDIFVVKRLRKYGIFATSDYKKRICRYVGSFDNQM